MSISTVLFCLSYNYFKAYLYYNMLVSHGIYDVGFHCSNFQHSEPQYPKNLHTISITTEYTVTPVTH